MIFYSVITVKYPFTPLNKSISDSQNNQSRDLSQELGDEDEALLSTALFYRANGTCPVTSTSAKTIAKTYSTVRSSSVSGKATQEGAINTFGDPFVTTVDSYLNATMPGK